MRNPDEDVAFEIMRQKQLDSGVRRVRVAWRSDFARTVDKDPNPSIPLSVPSEVPTWRNALLWCGGAAGLLLALTALGL